MDVKAGEFGTLSSPYRLIDPESGTVLLRLLPMHLDRLHRPSRRSAYVPCGGDPASPYAFPLLKNTSPVDVLLRGGVSPRRASAGIKFEPAGDFEGRAWWRWIAYALTPFGWVFHPTPDFRMCRWRQRLESLSLPPSCASPDESFAKGAAWLEHELGTPHEEVPGPPEARRRAWTYEWGRVDLWHEPRDGAAEVVIRWAAT